MKQQLVSSKVATKGDKRKHGLDVLTPAPSLTNCAAVFPFIELWHGDRVPSVSWVTSLALQDMHP